MRCTICTSICDVMHPSRKNHIRLQGPWPTAAQDDPPHSPAGSSAGSLRPWCQCLGDPCWVIQLRFRWRCWVVPGGFHIVMGATPQSNPSFERFLDLSEVPKTIQRAKGGSTPHGYTDTPPSFLMFSVRPNNTSLTASLESEIRWYSMIICWKLG